LNPRMLIKSAAFAGATAVLMSVAPLSVHAQGHAPGGSYLQSCTDVRVVGDRIVAECGRIDGTLDRTVLRDFDTCVGDIANMNGRLTCSRGGGYGSSNGYGPYAPRGYGWGR
jgi:hypothetical protein